MPQTNQNLKHSDQSVFGRVFQSLAGHSQEETVHCTSGTPSSDSRHVLQTWTDHSLEETSLHKVDTS